MSNHRIAPSNLAQVNMVSPHMQQPPHPKHDVPEVIDPGALPVDPDGEPTPPFIPDDPEADRHNDPGRPSPGSREAPLAPGRGGSAPVQGRAGRPMGRQVATPPRGATAPHSAPGMPLPHERDESTNPSGGSSDPAMAQASRDIDAGMVDTYLRATSGLDAARRAELVPGPGGKPPSVD